MNYIVYLIGQISKDPFTYQWRTEVEKYFHSAPTNSHVEIINPCRSEFNKKALTTMTETQNSSGKVYAVEGIKLLTPKDRRYVAQSNAAIANFNIYDKEKPLIGTIFELAWYYDSPDKMIIGFYDGDPTQNVWTRHPFVQNSVHVWVKDHKQACEILENYMDV